MPLAKRLLTFSFLAALCAALPILLINLSWFDEPLLPQLEALQKPPPLALEGNAYPFALGFLAAEDRDPHEAGIEIIRRMQARRDRGEPATIGKEEKQAILGAPLQFAARGNWSRPISEPSAGVASLGRACLPRYRLDCASQLIADAASIDLKDPQLAVLLARYENLLRQTSYVETPAPDPRSPWPPLGPIQELGRLRLALSYRTDPTDVFLEKTSQEIAFWRRVLRDGQLLGTKMSALAGLRWAHDFLSTLMRERDLHAPDIEQLRGFVRPFTPEESDIGAAFLAESRTALLGGEPFVARDAPWWIRSLMQKNATFNQQFRDTIQRMQERSALDARRFYVERAYEPLRHEFPVGPTLFYNLGGKLALSRSPWDPSPFPARVHDENGRILLLLLQAELEGHRDPDVMSIVAVSEHRDPYTGQAMIYDAADRTIRFACLHTAFHPPEPADRCVVALGGPVS